MSSCRVNEAVLPDAGFCRTVECSVFDAVRWAPDRAATQLVPLATWRSWLKTSSKSQMNMVEEASNAWLWCSRIYKSIDTNRSRSRAGKRDSTPEVELWSVLRTFPQCNWVKPSLVCLFVRNMLEGRPTTSSIRTHIWWSENDQQMCGPNTQTAEAPKMMH